MCAANQDLSDGARKLALLKFLFRARQRLLRLLVLVKWCAQLPLLGRCQQLLDTLANHDGSLTSAADSLWLLHLELQQARAPPYDVLTAIEVLGTGSFSRLPKCIEDLQGPTLLDGERREAAVCKIDSLLRSRLIELESISRYNSVQLALQLPEGLTSVRVEGGHVILRSKGQFEACLTLGYCANINLWHVVDVELLVGLAAGEHVVLAEPQKLALANDLDRHMAASTTPLATLCTILREACSLLTMDTLISQAQALQAGRWRGRITVEVRQGGGGTEGSLGIVAAPPAEGTAPSLPSLIVSYWVDKAKDELPGGITAKASASPDPPPALTIAVDDCSRRVMVSHSPPVLDAANGGEVAAFDLGAAGSIGLEALLLRAADCNVYTRLREVEKHVLVRQDLCADPGDVFLSHCGIHAHGQTGDLLGEEAADSSKERDKFGGYRSPDFGFPTTKEGAAGPMPIVLWVRAFGDTCIGLSVNLGSGHFMLHQTDRQTSAASSVVQELEEAMRQDRVAPAGALAALRASAFLGHLAALAASLSLVPLERGADNLSMPPGGPPLGSAATCLVLQIPSAWGNYYLALQLDEGLQPTFLLLQMSGASSTLAKPKVMQWMCLNIGSWTFNDGDPMLALMQEPCSILEKDVSINSAMQDQAQDVELPGKDSEMYEAANGDNDLKSMVHDMMGLVEAQGPRQLTPLAGAVAASMAEVEVEEGSKNAATELVAANAGDDGSGSLLGKADALKAAPSTASEDLLDGQAVAQLPHVEAEDLFQTVASPPASKPSDMVKADVPLLQEASAGPDTSTSAIDEILADDAMAAAAEIVLEQVQELPEEPSQLQSEAISNGSDGLQAGMNPAPDALQHEASCDPLPSFINQPDELVEGRAAMLPPPQNASAHRDGADGQDLDMTINEALVEATHPGNTLGFQSTAGLDISPESGNERESVAILANIMNADIDPAIYEEKQTPKRKWGDMSNELQSGSVRMLRRRLETGQQAQCHSLAGKSLTEIVTVANKSRRPDAIYLGLLLTALRASRLCIRLAALTRQLADLRIPVREHIGLESPSCDLKFRISGLVPAASRLTSLQQDAQMEGSGKEAERREVLGSHTAAPAVSDLGWLQILLRVSEWEEGDWEVLVRDPYYTAMCQLESQRGGGDQGPAAGHGKAESDLGRTTAVEEDGSMRATPPQYLSPSSGSEHMKATTEGLRLTFDSVEAGCVADMVADLRRAWKARHFGLSLQRLLLGQPLMPSARRGGADPSSRDLEAEWRWEVRRRSFRLTALGPTAVAFAFISQVVPNVSVQFDIEWSRGQELCQLRIVPDLWPHTKHLREFIDHGEVELLLDALRISTTPLHCLSAALRPLRSAHLQYQAQAASKAPSSISAGPPPVATLLPEDASIVIKSPFWSRIIFRKQFAIDMRCYDGDQVWLQPVPPSSSVMERGSVGDQGQWWGMLPCPQFRGVITDQIGHTIEALKAREKVGSPEGRRTDAGQAAAEAGAMASYKGLLSLQGSLRSRVVSPPAGGRAAAVLRSSGGSIVSSAAPGLVVSSGSDSGYAGAWVPTPVLKRALRGVMRYLGLLWLFFQIPDLINSILGPLLPPKEAALLSHDPEQPALKFFVGGYVYQVMISRQLLIMQVINTRAQQRAPRHDPLVDLSQMEMELLQDFFSKRVATEPHRAPRLASFLTILALPVPIIREFLGLVMWKREAQRGAALAAAAPPGDNPASEPKPRVELRLDAPGETQRAAVAYDKPNSLVTFSLTVLLEVAPSSSGRNASVSWLPYCVVIKIQYAFGGEVSSKMMLLAMEGSHGGQACWDKTEDWEKLREKMGRVVDVVGSGGEQQGSRLKAVAEAVQVALHSAVQQLRVPTM
eukprot:SM000328S12465  [mRNA]  locus=s328:100149:110500:- [translate_table: standard]